MKICFFGFYKSNYSRNKILMKGLRKQGIDVMECNISTTGWRRYYELILGYHKIRGSCDILFIPFPGYQAAILAKFLTRKPIVFDSFTSIYDSLVWDRRSVKPHSFKAYYYWVLDWLSMKLSDVVLFDTEAHIKYASRTFHVPFDKFARIFIGADTDIFSPVHINTNSHKHDIFKVLFFGTYIPLQGVEYIIQAAQILLQYKDISFNLIGSGQTKPSILNQVKDNNITNIDFIDNIDTLALKNYINEADACLGIFGSTNKTQRVIPNKVYECVAMKKAVITADTQAIRELFSEQELLLVPACNAKAIADAILHLKNNTELAQNLSNNAYQKFTSKASIDILGKQLQQVMCKLI